MECNDNVLSTNSIINSESFNLIIKELEVNDDLLIQFYNDYIDACKKIILEYCNNAIL